MLHMYVFFTLYSGVLNISCETKQAAGIIQGEKVQSEKTRAMRATTYVYVLVAVTLLAG